MWWIAQPSQSGNLSGRPKKKPITDELEREAALILTPEDCERLKLPPDYAGMTKGRAAARKAFEQALSGDVPALDVIIDRLEGKPVYRLRTPSGVNFPPGI